MLSIRAEWSQAGIGVMSAFGWSSNHLQPDRTHTNRITPALWFHSLCTSALPPYQHYKPYNAQQIKERMPVPIPTKTDVGGVTTVGPWAGPWSAACSSVHHRLPKHVDPCCFFFHATNLLLFSIWSRNGLWLLKPSNRKRVNSSKQRCHQPQICTWKI